MSIELYSKSGLKLPYLIDTDLERWYEEGKEKIKYIQKWAVLGTEANDFISGLSTAYNGKALTATSREDRGALTIITVTYGDAEATNSNEEFEWWTVSGGLYTRHRSKWVENTPTAIKAFCASCISQATYKDGCSVSCSPQAGEQMVLCEATFSDRPDTEEEDTEGGDGGDGGEGGDGGSGNGGETESDTKETGKSVQFSSSVETITLDYDTLKEKHPKIKSNQEALQVITLMENGSVTWQEANGGIIQKSGWYKVSNNTLALKEGPIISD